MIYDIDTVADPRFFCLVISSNRIISSRFDERKQRKIEYRYSVNCQKGASIFGNDVQ